VRSFLYARLADQIEADAVMAKLGFPVIIVSCRAGPAVHVRSFPTDSRVIWWSALLSSVSSLLKGVGLESISPSTRPQVLVPTSSARRRRPRMNATLLHVSRTTQPASMCALHLPALPPSFTNGPSPHVLSQLGVGRPQGALAV
jgi:hypothetical protein